MTLDRINRFTKGYYEMGEYECREAVIMRNTSIRPDGADSAR